MILNIFVFQMFFPAPALAIGEPLSSSITRFDENSEYTSNLFLKKTFSQGLWKIYVDGKNVGEGWNFREKDKRTYRDYVTIDPSTLNDWVEVMNGNINVVREGVKKGTIIGTKGIFNRYRIGHVLVYCGAEVRSYSSKIGGRLEITTAKNPDAIISVPKRTLSLGEKMNIAISGTNYITNKDAPSFFKDLDYSFYVDEKLVDSGIKSKKFSKSVSYTFNKKGTIELKLIVRDGRGKETETIEYITVGNGRPSSPDIPTNPEPEPLPEPEIPKNKPVAKIGAAPTVTVNETLKVENLSYDRDGEIVDVNWSISPINHNYNESLGDYGGEIIFFEEGFYGINLIVTDNDGLKDSDVFIVEVLSEPNSSPIPVIYGPKTSKQGEEIQIKDLSFDPDGKVIDKRYELVYKDTDEEVSYDDVTWEFEHVSDARGILESTGTFKFHQKEIDDITYMLKVTVIDDEGEEGYAEHEIRVTNDPPVARIQIPSEVIQGLEFSVNSSSYDSDGEIDRLEWEIVEPEGINNAIEGELTGEENKITLKTEGEYIIRLKVWDNFGLADVDEEVITVKPAIPEMDLWVSGTPKVNRKVNLELINVIETGGYKIDWDKTQWEITPVLSSGTSMSDIKVDTDSPIDNRAVLFKKAGKYNVRVRITNGLHWSDWAEQEIEIFPDEEPVADFYLQLSYIRDPENSNKATISPICTSYTTDGDIINQRIWSIRFDSDNDGDFSDEDRIVFSNNNDPNPSIEVDHVGKYLIELEVVEEFNQETIDKFVSSSDRKRDNTDDKDIAEKVTEVINVAPYTNFEVKEKKKVDLIFTVGDTEPSKIDDLAGKVETHIKSKLLANNIDAEDIYIETLINFEEIILAGTFKINIYWANNGSDMDSHMYFYSNGREVGHLYYGNKNLFGCSLDYDDTRGGTGEWLTINFEEIPTHIDEIIFQVHPYRGSAETSIKLYKEFNGESELIINETRQVNSTEYFGKLIKNGDFWDFISWDNRVFPGKVSERKIKSLDEVLKEPNWRDGAIRFIANISDVKLPELDDPDKRAFILSNLLNNKIYFCSLGTSTNKSQFESLISQNSGRGIHFNNTNIDNTLKQLADYILSVIGQESKTNVRYILVNEKVEYETFYKDHEDDPEYRERWMYQHTPNYFENHMGTASFNNTWLYGGPVTIFDKVGMYNVYFQKEDNPSSNPLFANYRQWSNMPTDGLTLFVHRKPIADFQASVEPINSNSYRVIIDDRSYDLDHETSHNKGISEKRWSYKEANDEQWTSGMIPQTIQAGKTYLIQLEVRDVDGPDGKGEWSDPVVRMITTKNVNLPPVALFSLEHNTVSNNSNIIIYDQSYDPNGHPIGEYKWKLEKVSDNGGILYEGSNLPLNFPKTYGIGRYKITLQVKDNPPAGYEPLWSDPYSQFVEVIPENQKPIAEFEIILKPDGRSNIVISSSGNIPKDTPHTKIEYQDKSYDPDGDPIVLREWRMRKSTDSDWTAIPEPPKDFSSFSTGTYYIELRVLDQPILPQLEAKWSDWYRVTVQITEGNRKPVARLSVTPNPAATFENLTFRDNGSYDPDGQPIKQWHWQIWLDGELKGEYMLSTNNQSVIDSTIPRNFASMGWGNYGAGEYTVRLRVLDTSPDGLSPELWSDWASQNVTIQLPLEIISAEVKPSQFPAGYKIEFEVVTDGYADQVEIEMPLGIHWKGDVISLTPENSVDSKANTWRGTYITNEKTPNGVYVANAKAKRTIILPPEEKNKSINMIVAGNIYQQFKVRIRDNR